MIEQISDRADPVFLRLDAENGVDARMLAYLDAYGTGYDFCRFFKADGALLLNYEGEVMITADSTANGEELALFLAMGNTTAAEVNKTAFKLMKPYIKGHLRVLKLIIMKADAGAVKGGDTELVFTEDYRTVHEIISDAFGTNRSNFDRWYADNNHRVRHKVSKLILVYKEDVPSAACTVFYNGDKAAFLSHIGVKKQFQGQGIGKALVQSVCANLCKPVLLECKKERVGFYKRCGFKKHGRSYGLLPLR